MMKYILFSFLFISYSNWSFAQEENEPIPDAHVETGLQVNSNHLFGKIMETATGKALQAASVQLYTLNTNKEDSLIAGMFTQPNGDFKFNNVPDADSLRLHITAVGYTTEVKNISFKQASSFGNPIVMDVGNIMLKKDVQFLGAIVVTAERPSLQMGIDRKIFNVEKSLTATGGTGLDVMKNIPSVTVDVEGNVQLRNAEPQIFVDGRPTILTLDQIPANNIERVELITNPSAKFDAASTGGIINVILKKNKRVGINGIASAGAGYPDILNGNLNLNVREGKVNFFVSGGFNQSGGRAKSQTFRQNKKAGVVQNFFNQNSFNDRLRRFSSVRAGVDYFIDNRNTLSLSQNFVKGKFSNDQTQEQEYLNANEVLERYGDRISDGASDFTRNSTQLYYLHKFPELGKELTATVNYNSGDGNNLTNTFNTFYYPNGTEYSEPAQVKNLGENNSDQLTMQVDYTIPKGENSKIETGARSYINHQLSSFNSFAINNNIETKLPLSNNYDYREMVNALYVTYSNKWKGIRYQAGLRAEQSKFDGELLDSAKTFGYQYPNQLKQLFDALFPSLFLTKELNDKAELQLNFSRRIRRPNFWNLNPFIDINDPVNLRQGNPQLKPEFTNSFEVNYSQQYKGGNFLGVVYYRNNQGDITRYSDTISAAQFQQLNNAAVDPNAILNTFINAQFTNRLGAEFTLQHKLGKNFDLTPTINLQYRAVKAEVGDLVLNNKGFSWESKLITNYKIVTERSSLFNQLGFQMIGEYESPEVIPQGKRSARYSVDVAVRKEFLEKNKASFTLSVNDVFNTHRYGTIYDTETFYQDSYGRRNVRNFRLSFTYKFGSTDLSLFRRGAERGGRSNEGNGSEE